MDGPTDQRTDRWTDKAGCRVAQHATKNCMCLIDDQLDNAGVSVGSNQSIHSTAGMFLLMQVYLLDLTSQFVCGSWPLPPECSCIFHSSTCCRKSCTIKRPNQELGSFYRLVKFVGWFSCFAFRNKNIYIWKSCIEFTKFLDTKTLTTN